MTIWWLAVVLGSLAAGSIGFIWIVVALSRIQSGNRKPADDGDKAYADQAEEETSHLFNKEFREELRNRGRLHFEKIIGENAMFLQQDLRLTTSELNEYMKAEITKKLKEEFAKYEESIMDAKQLAIDSIQKTNDAIEEQRQYLGQQMQHEIDTEKAETLKRFDENTAEVVEHYISMALGEQMDLKAQLPYIMKQMEAHKKEILEDMKL